MIIMVVNYLTKVPKEGFMMHPETWVDLRVSKCIGTLFSNHASTWFWGALGAWWEAVQKLMWYWEAWAQGRKGLMGAYNDILLKLQSVNLEKKKKNSIIQIEETLKCCCKLVFARLVQAVMVTPSSRHTHRAFGISNKVQSIMWIFGHITLSHITQGKHLGHQVNSFHKYDVRSQRRLERCGSLHRGASMCHLGLFVSLLRQLCWTN